MNLGKHLHRLTILLFLTVGLMSCKTVAVAQSGDWMADAEYGDISELAGKHRVYVTSDSLEAREKIVKEISKYLGLEVVGRREDADFLLLYAAESMNTGASIGLFGQVTRDSAIIGQLLAVTIVKAPASSTYENRVRIHWSTKKSQNYAGGITLSRNPSTNAVREFLKAYKAIDNSGATPNASSMEASLHRGAEFYKQNKFEEAATEFRDAIRLDPKIAVLHAVLGSTLLQQKKFAEAEAEVREAIRLESKTAQFHAILGEVFDHQQKFTEAEAAYRKAFQIDSNDAYILNDLGYFLAERGKELDTSLQMLKRAVSAEPSNGYYLDSLGWVYFNLGRYDEAEHYLTEALKAKNSPLDTPHEHLGDLYQKRGKMDLARAAWREALAVSVDPDKKERLMAKINGEAKQ